MPKSGIIVDIGKVAPYPARSLFHVFLEVHEGPYQKDDGDQQRNATGNDLHSPVSYQIAARTEKHTPPHRVNPRLKSPTHFSGTTLSLTRMVFETAQAQIRRQHPEIGEREVFLRAAARHLDRETMMRVYRRDPESVDA